MARNLLKRFNNIEEYNLVKCILDERQVSFIKTDKEITYGSSSYLDSMTFNYKVNNTSNSIKLFYDDSIITNISQMKINGIEVEPTNEFQFNEYGIVEVEIGLCSITSIPDYAFSGCTFLKEITIPSSVTSIGDYAFAYCYSLTSITIPSSVTSIGYEAFVNCYSLVNVTFEEGSQLTSIGNSAFGGCSSLISITIPSGVTSIGEIAFAYCYSLSSIEIPSGVTSIGYAAFSGCYSLSSITIPSGVTSITNYAFSGCSSLNSIVIPSGIISIGKEAFKECYSLASVTFEEGSQLKKISNNVFTHCYSLNNITIPNGVISIGEEVFENCDSLSSVTIPSSVTSIGDSAFYSCSSLSEITCLASTAPTISFSTFSYIQQNGILYYPSGSDYSSWMSTSSNYLGYYNWISIHLQDSYDFKVNFITNGVRVESPYNSLIINGIQGVKQDDNSYLFSGLQPTDDCYEFDLITDGEIIDKVDIKHKNKWITVGDNSSMLTCVYNTCQSTRIYSGSNLTYSGAYVDGEYIGTLTSSYTFTEISEHIIQYSGVTSIGSSTFADCYSLSSIEIPSGVTSIGTSAFTNCYSLSSIELPNSVTSIGTSAFTNCYSLSSIELPNSVTTIGNRAFYNCSSLSEITIPSGVTSIVDGAFYYCYSLSSIELPNSVTSIGSSTFSKCSSLSEITIPSGVTSIGSYAFADCYSLSSIEIPSGVTSIVNRTFSGCYSLSSVTIPSSVTSIGDSAFAYCSSLSSIEIPSGVTSIGSSTFSNCSSLSSIEIPSDVTSIGNKAFAYCKSLSEIICLAEIPPIITENSFSDILDLGVVYYPVTQNYDSWKPYFPSGWDFVQLYTPQECTNLVISAEDVNGKATSTTISYTATTNGVDNNGNIVTNIIITGTSVSAPFEQNTDLNNVITRTITFEYLGATASTTITQGVWIDNYWIPLSRKYESAVDDYKKLYTTVSPQNKVFGVFMKNTNEGNEYCTNLDFSTVPYDLNDYTAQTTCNSAFQVKHFPVQNIHIRIQNNYSPKRYILYSETKSTEKYVEPSRIVDGENITTYSGLTSTTIECEGNNINGYVILFNEPMYLTQCQPAVDTDNFYLLVENETEFAMFI